MFSSRSHRLRLRLTRIKVSLSSTPLPQIGQKTLQEGTFLVEPGVKSHKNDLRTKNISPDLGRSAIKGVKTSKK